MSAYQENMRLMNNLVKTEKDAQASLKTWIQDSESATAALHAWSVADSSATPDLQAAVERIVTLLAACFRAEREYSHAISVYRNALIEVSAREGSLKSVLKDREILVARAIKLGNKRPSDSALGAHQAKLADAQRELQACEAFLQEEEMHVRGLKRWTYREALAMRMRHMGDVATALQECAKESVMLLTQLGAGEMGDGAATDVSGTGTIAPSHDFATHDADCVSAVDSITPSHSASQQNYGESSPHLGDLAQKNGDNVGDKSPSLSPEKALLPRVLPYHVPPSPSIATTTLAGDLSGAESGTERSVSGRGTLLPDSGEAEQLNGDNNLGRAHDATNLVTAESNKAEELTTGVLNTTHSAPDTHTPDPSSSSPRAVSPSQDAISPSPVPTLPMPDPNNPVVSSPILHSNTPGPSDSLPAPAEQEMILQSQPSFEKAALVSNAKATPAKVRKASVKATNGTKARGTMSKSESFDVGALAGSLSTPSSVLVASPRSKASSRMPKKHGSGPINLNANPVMDYVPTAPERATAILARKDSSRPTINIDIPQAPAAQFGRKTAASDSESEMHRAVKGSYGTDRNMATYGSSTHATPKPISRADDTDAQSQISDVGYSRTDHISVFSRGSHAGTRVSSTARGSRVSTREKSGSGVFGSIAKLFRSRHTTASAPPSPPSPHGAWEMSPNPVIDHYVGKPKTPVTKSKRTARSPSPEIIAIVNDPSVRLNLLTDTRRVERTSGNGSAVGSYTSVSEVRAMSPQSSRGRPSAPVAHVRSQSQLKSTPTHKSVPDMRRLSRGETRTRRASDAAVPREPVVEVPRVRSKAKRTSLAAPPAQLSRSNTGTSTTTVVTADTITAYAEQGAADPLEMFRREEGVGGGKTKEESARPARMSRENSTKLSRENSTRQSRDEPERRARDTQDKPKHKKTRPATIVEEPEPEPEKVSAKKARQQPRQRHLPTAADLELSLPSAPVAYSPFAVPLERPPQLSPSISARLRRSASDADRSLSGAPRDGAGKDPTKELRRLQRRAQRESALLNTGTWTTPAADLSEKRGAEVRRSEPHTHDRAEAGGDGRAERKTARKEASAFAAREQSRGNSTVREAGEKRPTPIRDHSTQSIAQPDTVRSQNKGKQSLDVPLSDHSMGARKSVRLSDKPVSVAMDEALQRRSLSPLSSHDMTPPTHGILMNGNGKPSSLLASTSAQLFVSAADSSEDDEDENYAQARLAFSRHTRDFEKTLH